MNNQDISSEKIEQLHLEVRKRLKDKQSTEQIINALTSQGIEPYYIETIIQNVEEENADKKSFRNSMIMGIVYIIGGLATNYFSWKFASESGNLFFYVFWGIVVLGIVTIVRGFILYRR